MGVLYHLRHPLLALDLIREHVVGDLLVFQSHAARQQRDRAAASRDYPFSETEIFDQPGYPKLHFVEQRYAARSDQLVDPQPRLRRGDAAQRRLRDRRPPGGGGLHLPRAEPSAGAARSIPSMRRNAQEQHAMIEAVMIWNEPNNKSHWDPEIDPDWELFAAMATPPREAIARRERPTLPRVLGGMSPIDPAFMRNIEGKGVLGPRRRRRRARLPARLEPLADPRMAGQARRDPRRHGHADLGHARSASPPSAPRRCRCSGLQAHRRTADRPAPRIHWYSLYDLPRAWPATTRHREAEGSSYYRHFYMGLLREDGTPKLGAEAVPRVHARAGHLPVVPLRGSPARRRRAPGCKRLGVQLSAHRASAGPTASAPTRSPGSTGRWRRSSRFDVTVTFCFTPEHRGIEPHHTSPPQDDEEFAEFCARMIRRYAPGTSQTNAALAAAEA